jgi:hypothetical protein
MVLVDTSVWVAHLNRGNNELAGLLNRAQVLSHPFVLGELALACLQQRNTVLNAVQNLPQAHVPSAGEVLGFITTHALHVMGIGFVAVYLLASARLGVAASVLRCRGSSPTCCQICESPALRAGQGRSINSANPDNSESGSK